TNLMASDVELRHSGYDLFVRDLRTGQEIRVENQFYAGPEYGVEELRFADGTIWNRSAIQQRAWIRGDAGNNSLYGTASDDTFLGAGGDDYLEGRSGSDTYIYASGDG